MVTQKEGNALWSSFLECWSIESLEKMTLEEYSTSGDKECFTYWVEHGSRGLGSIVGGSAFKFGVFHRFITKDREDDKTHCYSDKYAWYRKYGKTENEAFTKVHSCVVKIATYARDGKFEDIEKIAFSPAYKWKIASLYQDRENPVLVNVFKKDSLKAYLGISEKKSFLEMYHLVRDKHPDMPIFELGQQVWDESRNALSDSKLSDELDDKDFDDTLHTKKTSLNQIFYGPPGTGKTYNTINAALEIIDPEFTQINDRIAVKTRFDQLMSEQRIGFVTFHQSFSYEDFVEGLKPEPDENGTLNYIVADGLFKKMCDLAASRIEKESNDEISLDNRSIWKMSLGNTLGDDAYIYDECLENNYVLLGYGDDIDFSHSVDRSAIIKTFNNMDYEVDNGSYQVTAVNTFIHRIAKGDLIVISDGNAKYRAIAEVTSDYQYLDNDRDAYRQSRSVRWLKTFIPSRPRDDIFHKAISQMTIYELRHSTLNLKNLSNILAPKSPDAPEKLPYVLIIDEINRGNTASIFGELITLIESSKRTGADEALSISLPYSKESFSVPDNLYIIGTMNTADRSLSLMDSALRRRFKFKEMLPDYSVLKGIEVKGIAINTMLETMNQRIEALFDREHMLGHAFFLPLKTDNSIELLKSIFRDEIIPLLKEYFFEDWSKIQLVLADNQKIKNLRMIISNQQNNLFGDDENISIAKTYTVNNAALDQAESYMNIYNLQPKSA